MFGFMHKSGPGTPSSALRRALESDGLQTGTDADTLRVVESRGTYAGRKVTYIRVFDPASAAASGLMIQSFKDLDGPRSQVLRAGHIEQNGAVVLNRV